MCIPCFVSISHCVRELHGHLSSYHKYGLRLLIVVLQEISTMLLIIVVCTYLLKSVVTLHLLVSEIAKCIA